MSSFNELAEGVLVGAADLQAQFDQRSVDLSLILERLGQDLPIAKQFQLLEYLKSRGWIDSSDSTLKSLRLRLTGQGQMEAERLLELRSRELEHVDNVRKSLALNSKKIQLAVLHELFGYAERNHEDPTPELIAQSFKVPSIARRRVEIALGELEALSHAECVPDPSAGVYRWRITGEGFGVVDRALRVPTSFIARLSSHGNDWLSTEDAKKAVLKNIAKEESSEPVPDPLPRAPQPIPINITNTFAPVNHNSHNTQPDNSVNWSGWISALIALLVGIGAILATLRAAGKI